MFVDVLYSELDCMWKHPIPIFAILENLVAIENELLGYYIEKGNWFAFIIKKK